MTSQTRALCLISTSHSPDQSYIHNCLLYVFLIFFLMIRLPPTSSLFPYTILFFFFFNDTATTEIYTLSLHDALPISLDLTPSIVGRIAEASLLIELLAMLSPITAVVHALFLRSHLSIIRSEERRGGEEWRSWWSPYH